MPQLSADCLNEIFEYLESEKIFTLHSCLLVNRLWCEISVRILWRNSWNYNFQTCNTLFTCLPNKSKDILHNNEIIIPTPSKPPMFNYAAFCKVLSINHFDYIMIEWLHDINVIEQLYDVVKQEIYKLFISQTSLKKFELDLYNPKVIFTSYPGANNCLKNLSELCCSSDIHSEIFYQLSQICHTIQSFNIKFKSVSSSGLTDLISVQKNLKYLSIKKPRNCIFIKDVTPLLKKLSSASNTFNTLIKLDLDGYSHCISLSFISNFINLQELVLKFDYEDCFMNFESVTLPQLQILKFPHNHPESKLLFKFLENNGKNLKEFHQETECVDNNSSNLAIAKFCPNLRKLSTGFGDNELETLKIVFDNCKYLESINIWCGDYLLSYLSEKVVLETVVKYSSKNFSEIILNLSGNAQLKLLPGELDSFLVSWKERIPQNPLSLIIFTYTENGSLEANYECIIQKYIKLGVIKKFDVILQPF